VKQLDYIKQILSQLKPELAQKYHVTTIGLFGSAVRDDFSPFSDIDIIVDFNRPVGIEFIDLANYIEKCLQKKVDLVSKKGIKDKYYQAIESEIVYV
jgi:predicted nucleotidyltransferase